VIKVAQKSETVAELPTTPAYAHQPEEEVSSYQPLAENRKNLVELAERPKVALKPVTVIDLLSTPTPTLKHKDESEEDPDQTLVEPEGSMSLPAEAHPIIPSSPPALA